MSNRYYESVYRVPVLLAVLWMTACSGSEPEVEPDTDEPLATGGTETDNFETDATETGGTDTAVEVVLPPANLFTDGFESADMLSTNSDGFFWEANNRTSVVTQDATDGTVAVYNNGEIYTIADPIMGDGTVRDWTAYEGQYSLRFRYPANEPQAEQRFDLGQPQTNLWVRFWLQVPRNYEHGDATDSRNQKLLAIWSDDYSAGGDGSTVWLTFWPSSVDGTDSEVAFSYSQGGQTASGGNNQMTPFIDSSEDKGRWMQIVFHVQAESADGVDDGVIETWRRWQDEDTFTKWHEAFDLGIKLPTDGPAGFQRGYLMGWANGEYVVDTEFLLDMFELSTEPLVPNYP